jgi:hypothetical protein
LLKETLSQTNFSLVFWVVEGKLFQINYSKSPISIMGSKDVRNFDGHVVRCNILNDPLHPDFATFPRSRLQNDAKRIIESELKREVYLSSLSGPVEEVELIRYFDQLGFKIPEDYLKIMKISDGCVSGNWKLLSVKSAQEISLEDDTYLMIAENEGQGCILVKRSDRGSLIYYHNYITDGREFVGSRLVDSMDAVDAKFSDS